MSERRMCACEHREDVHHWEDPYGCEECDCSSFRWREPQEGAPVRSPTIGDGDRGVPSCDSPELCRYCDHAPCACAARVTHDLTGDSPELAHCRQQIALRSADWVTADALLRMVDELAERVRFLDADRAKLGEKNERLKNNWRATERERDDLRAKLQEHETRNDPQWDATDAAHPAWWRGHDHAAAQFAKRMQEMNVAHARLTDELRAKLAEAEKATDNTQRLLDEVSDDLVSAKFELAGVRSELTLELMKNGAYAAEVEQLKERAEAAEARAKDFRAELLVEGMRFKRLQEQCIQAIERSDWRELLRTR